MLPKTRHVFHSEQYEVCTRSCTENRVVEIPTPFKKKQTIFIFVVQILSFLLTILLSLSRSGFNFHIGICIKNVVFWS